jgi:glycosyltransferase involved in cell wall biosynthesis
MRLAVYTDYAYRQDAQGVVTGERAFVLFMTALRPRVDRLVLVGRLHVRPGRSRYPLGEGVEFVGLPYYESLARPRQVLGSLAGSMGRFWRLLDDVDTVWLLGPYAHAIGFALLALARRRRVVLGVRQDLPRYIRARRPNARWMHVAADLLEVVWKLLARRHAVVVVGPELERRYGHARSLLATTVSLVHEHDVIEPAQLAGRTYDGELTLLTVGRIDVEKNPLLLADILARLLDSGRDWRLVVCGEGPLHVALQARLQELGLLDRVELRGYVPIDGGLLDLYRRSHAFLHVSLTEGFPQVLVEAFASGLPVVATAVGGVPAAAAGAALLVQPRDAAAAADALERIVADADLRERLIAAGLERAREGTLEAAAERLARFLAARS